MVDEGKGADSTAAAPAEKLPFAKAILGDLMSGLGASLAVAPFILAVDKAVIQNTAGSDTLLSSLRKSFGELFMRPHHLLRRPELYFIWGVYSSTYMIANVIDTVGEQIERDSAFAKFVGASAGTLLQHASYHATFCLDSLCTTVIGSTSASPSAIHGA